MKKNFCVIFSDIVKTAPETLPASTIGAFTHFFVLPNYFTQKWGDLVLGFGGVQVTKLSGGVSGRRWRERRIWNAKYSQEQNACTATAEATLQTNQQVF